MAICNRRDENYQNQLALENFLFGSSFNPSNIQFKNDGKIVVIKTNLGMVFTLERTDKPLGKGSYGAVYKYTDKINKVNIALKVTQENDEEEIANQLRKSNCSVLAVRYLDQVNIDNDYMFVYFMELAEGDLEKWVNIMLNKYPNGIPKQAVYKVCFSIWQQLSCLLKMGRYYTDMKLGNVLFKCPKPNDIEENDVRFMLGDLGSAVPNPVNGIQVATYPPYEYKSEGGHLVGSDSVIAWEFGILVLSLVIMMEGVPKDVVYKAKSLYNKLFFQEIDSVSVQELKSTVQLINQYSIIDLQMLLEPTGKRSFPKSLVAKQTISPRVFTQVVQRVPSQRVSSQRLPSQRLPSQRLPSQRLPSQRLPSQRVPSQRQSNRKKLESLNDLNLYSLALTLQVKTRNRTRKQMIDDILKTRVPKKTPVRKTRSVRRRK